MMGNTDIGSIAEAGRSGIFTVIWDVTWPFLLGMVGGIICFPLAAVALIGKEIWDMTRSDEERERAALEKIQKDVEKIIDKVRPEIARAVSDRKLRDGIAIPLTGALRQSVDRIEAMLRKQLDDIKTDFEKERVAKPQAMFDKSADERKRIAEANKAERIDVIEPLRERIEAFASIVTEELAG